MWTGCTLHSRFICVATSHSSFHFNDLLNFYFAPILCYILFGGGSSYSSEAVQIVYETRFIFKEDFSQKKLS